MMKKLILFTILSFLCLTASSQQRYPGQWVLKGGGGGNVSAAGYYVNIGTEYIFTPPHSSIQLEIIYGHNTYSTKIEEDIKVNNIFVRLDYSYTFFTNSNVRLSLFPGVFIGNQQIPDKLIDGVEINAKGGLMWGLSFSAQVDFVIAPTWSIYLQPSGLYNIKSEIDELDFLIGVGVKKYF